MEEVKFSRSLTYRELFILVTYRFLVWLVTKIFIIFTVDKMIKRRFMKSAKCPAIKDPLLQIPAHKLASLIRHKKVNSETVVKSYIERIKAVNPIINAVVEERFEAAISDAKQIDLIRTNGGLTLKQLKEQYPLMGVPLTVKGSIQVKGMGCNAGVVGRNVIAEEDADAIQRFRKAGAIPLLTSNVPELCLNWETSNKVIGLTRNPYNNLRTAGGSSGGEAALISSGASLMGIGSDLVGSLRIPAHFCGIWSHKPTTGLISNIGHYPNGLDQERWDKIFSLGPMTRYASDLRLVFNTIIKPEMVNVLKLDEKVDLREITVYYREDGINSIFHRNTSEDVKKAIRQVVEHFTRSSIRCVKYDHPLFFTVDSAVLMSLVKNNDNANVIRPSFFRAFWDLFQYMLGYSKHELLPLMYNILSHFTFAFFESLQRLTDNRFNDWKNDLYELLDSKGVLLLPMFNAPAHLHYDILKNVFATLYAGISNLLGCPSTNCPITYTQDGLPIGIQIISLPLCDRLNLAFAEEIERAFGGWKPPQSSYQ